jgi:hypothetical protein
MGPARTFGRDFNAAHMGAESGTFLTHYFYVRIEASLLESIYFAGARTRDEAFHSRFDPAAFIKNRNLFSSEQRIQKDVQAESRRVSSARHLQGGDATAVRAGRSKLLSGRLFSSRVQNEAGRMAVHQLFARGAKVAGEVGYYEIENAKQVALNRKDQVRLARNTFKPSAVTNRASASIIAVIWLSPL